MLSVVIPVYNEAKCLSATLLAVGEHLARLTAAAAGAGGSAGAAPFEIVVADDGSRDESVALAQALADRLPIRIERLAENRGKGAAVRAGMLAARGDPIFYFDADLSTPLAEMERFLAALAAGADLVVGTRKHPQARIERWQPPHRVWLGRCYTRLANAVLGLAVSDFTCGFKAFRAAAAREIFTRGRLDRWSFDAEILFLARHLGLRLAELPVRWADRPDSRVRVGSAMVKSFAELLAIRRHARHGDYGPESSSPR